MKYVQYTTSRHFKAIYIYFKFGQWFHFIFVKVKDQQEAERKKVTSQELQGALEDQNRVIAEKKKVVHADLAQVEPAVIEAQQGQ
jgi:hypothetical protein